MAKEELNAFLGANTIYEGKLNFEGSVHIDGKFNGEIISDGSLVIGKEAEVRGTINVGELSLSGLLVGDVKARRRVIIHSSGVLDGQVNTPALVMEEGGIIDGNIIMRKEAVIPQQL